MIDWLKFHFSASYLFNKAPAVKGNSLLYLSIFFAIVIIVGILVSRYLDKFTAKIPVYKDLKDKVFSDFLAIGIAGIIFVFFRWQQIPYFSAPIIMVLLLLVSIVVFVYIIIFWRKSIKTKTKNIDIEEEYQKYLPHKKQSK